MTGSRAAIAGVRKGFFDPCFGMTSARCAFHTGLQAAVETAQALTQGLTVGRDIVLQQLDSCTGRVASQLCVMNDNEDLQQEGRRCRGTKVRPYARSGGLAAQGNRGSGSRRREQGLTVLAHARVHVDPETPILRRQDERGSACRAPVQLPRRRIDLRLPFRRDHAGAGRDLARIRAS